jgi:hypothetical protein
VESCSDPFLGGMVGCSYDTMYANCTTCHPEDCSKAPFMCAQKYLDTCGPNASNTSVISESFRARVDSCVVSPTDRTAAFWNHPGYVMSGSFRTLTTSNERSIESCAQICGRTDSCNAFIYIENQVLCMALAGSDDFELCAEGSPGCVYTVMDTFGQTSEILPTGNPMWMYDTGGVYCAPNAMECGCTREYWQCILQNQCEGDDQDVAAFADMCSARGCSSDQCGLRFSQSSSFASACTNNFFECVTALPGECGCIRTFVDCMDTDQDAVAIDLKTGLSLVDMCTLQGCTAADCGFERDYCNATILRCADEHMHCTGGAYERISWNPLKTGFDGAGYSQSVTDDGDIVFEKGDRVVATYFVNDDYGAIRFQELPGMVYRAA